MSTELMAEKPIIVHPESTALALAVAPRSLQEVMDLAERVAKSSIVPEQFRNKPADVLVAMVMGMEVGLKPLQALQSIAVINGRPSLWGDGARGLVMASGLVESIKESDPREVERTGIARCEIIRKGIAEAFVGQFGKADAERAGLTSKDSYRKFPVQMYIWRAFHQAARKGFPDIYRGLSSAEEIIDVTPIPEKPPDSGELKPEEMPRAKLSTGITQGLSATWIPRPVVTETLVADGEANPNKGATAERIPKPAPQPSVVPVPANEAPLPRQAINTITVDQAGALLDAMEARGIVGRHPTEEFLIAAAGVKRAEDVPASVLELVMASLQ